MGLAFLRSCCKLLNDVLILQLHDCYYEKLICLQDNKIHKNVYVLHWKMRLEREH